MLQGHEVMWWPWMAKRGQESDIDQIVASARQDMEAEMLRCHESPTEYEWDVLTDGKAVKMGSDLVVPGVGKVPADVVMAGIVIAWRKGTPKPRLHATGKVG